MSLLKKIFQEKTENFSDATWFLKAQDLWNYNTANYSNPKKALKYLERAIQLNPNKDEAYWGQGTAYLQLGKHQQAIEAFNQAIHINPNGGSYYMNRGQAYMQLGNYEKAIEDFNQLFHIEPDHFKTVAYLFRGLAYWELGKHQRAIEDYSQLIRIDPNDASNYNIRGWAYSEIGKQKEAISDFDKALQLINIVLSIFAISMTALRISSIVFAFIGLTSLSMVHHHCLLDHFRILCRQF